MKPTKQNLLILPALFLSAGLSNAALIAYDGFDYGSPGGDLTGKNGGTGWSGAYTTASNSTVYTTTGLTYTGLTTTGGAVNTSDGSGLTTTSFRGFNAISSGEMWISFLAQRNTGASGSTFAGVSFYNSGGTDNGANGEFGIANSAGDVWRIVDPSTGGTSTTTTVSITEATTFLLVAQVIWSDVGDETVNLWVNPAIGGTLGTANATQSMPMSNIDKVRIAGATAVDYTFDEVRIGTTFASVTVPEPSTALLGGLGLLALLRRRRA
jgi:hypothetical protein